MTILQRVRNGEIPKELISVSKNEKMDIDTLKEKILKGEIIIPRNNLRKVKKFIGIGTGLKTKVNSNIGTSTDYVDIGEEVKKAKLSEEVKADTIMDLSTGGDLKEIRKRILDAVSIPLGTVPIYEAAIETIKEKGVITKMTAKKIFDVIERQAKEGVDFMTVHSGVTKETFKRLQRGGRMMDIVSRGGAFLITWMVANKKENPLFEHFDTLLDIAEKYDITLSLGDGLRPGAIADSTDRSQIQELTLLGELAAKSLERGVQVMIEGPGHIPINEVEMNIKLQKKLCHNAPFYVLGPVVTDIAPGYDHITSAIGGAIASASGADFLCYVTPAEHLALPTLEDVKEGIIATRIAAHTGDIAKGIKGSFDWDMKMAQARKTLDWGEQIRLSINPEYAAKVRRERSPQISDVCTMCGEYCAIKLVEEALENSEEDVFKDS